MNFWFNIRVEVGKFLANLLSASIPNKALRRRVRERLHPLNPERCVSYLQKHYTHTDAIAEEAATGVNKPIWVCWLQGVNQAPALVQRCIQSIEHFKRPDQQVIVITAQNYADYVTLPDVIIDKWHRGLITNTHFSDLFRIYALARHGGCWIDATCLLTAPVPDDILNRPLFLLRSHGEFAYTCIQSCFICAEINNYVLRKWCAAMAEYWSHEDKLIHYFTLHLMFIALLRQDSRFAEEFKKVPEMSDEPMHLFLNEMMKGNAYSDELMERARHQAFFQKLTYKTETPWNIP